MDENDKKIVELTAKLAARDVANELRSSLKCNEHGEKLAKHESLLHDGLQKTINDHIDVHKKDQQERNKHRRRFWLALGSGTIIAAIGTLIGFILSIFL